MAKFEDIIQGNTLVFVDFFATWCGPCKMMHPVLEGLKKQLGERVKIVKIDIDSPVNRQLVNSYQVQAVPTLMLFKAGKMVWRQSGAMQATQIRQVIEKHLWLSVFYISSVRDHPNRECIKLFEYPVFGMSEISFVG